MGYNTQFKGQLSFTAPVTDAQLEALQGLLGEDCRDHPEWATQHLYYIDMALTQGNTGLEWNGAEKTYDLDQLVNVVLRVMRTQWPDFGLAGALIAQGDEMDDRWVLSMEPDGWAHKLPLAPSGPIIACPHCQKSFMLEGALRP